MRLRPIAREGGIGVLYVEQHVHFALDLADCAHLMSRGRIALSAARPGLCAGKGLVRGIYRDE